jgi:hypothetical protein
VKKPHFQLVDLCYEIVYLDAFVDV